MLAFLLFSRSIGCGCATTPWPSRPQAGVSHGAGRHQISWRTGSSDHAAPTAAAPRAYLRRNRQRANGRCSSLSYPSAARRSAIGRTFLVFGTPASFLRPVGAPPSHAPARRHPGAAHLARRAADRLVNTGCGRRRCWHGDLMGAITAALLYYVLDWHHHDRQGVRRRGAYVLIASPASCSACRSPPVPPCCSGACAQPARLAADVFLFTVLTSTGWQITGHRDGARPDRD